MPSDAYVYMELGIPRGEYDSLMNYIVKQRKLDDYGNPIGTESTNPLVDARAYDISLLMAPLKHSQITSLQRTYLHRLMKKYK